jgi:3-methyladenine DNA glycosylase AlkD
VTVRAVRAVRAVPGDPGAAAESGHGDVNGALIDALKTAFVRHADPAQAGPMQAYMKSALPFHGIKTPLRRQLQAASVATHPCTDVASLAATMRRLWQTAGQREVRYAALELARVGPHRSLIDLSLMPVYEWLIVDGAWWDYDDDISGHALPALWRLDPPRVKARLRRWAQGSDLWLRRAAMLAQRSLKHDADAALFYDCIRPSLGHEGLAREFFIRKGMGWALRERARWAPDEVQAFCEAHAAQLSPLTLREALRGLRRRAADG